MPSPQSAQTMPDPRNALTVAVSGASDECESKITSVSPPKWVTEIRESDAKAADSEATAYDSWTGMVDWTEARTALYSIGPNDQTPESIVAEAWKMFMEGDNRSEGLPDKAAVHFISDQTQSGGGTLTCFALGRAPYDTDSMPYDHIVPEMRKTSGIADGSEAITEGK